MQHPATTAETFLRSTGGEQNLYDYQTDPQGNENVAGEPGRAQLVERLGRQLAEGLGG